MINLKSLKNAILSFNEVLFAPACLICRSPSSQILCHRCLLPEVLHSKADIRCSKCHGRIPGGESCIFCRTWPPAFSQARFLWEYSDNARDFCVALKYRPSLRLIDYGAQLLAREIFQLFDSPDWDFIVPVPASISGMKKRGFNHVEIMAERFVRFSGMDGRLLPVLAVNSKRKPQASLSNRARMAGMQNRYRLWEKHSRTIKNSRILLLDDVTTTGSTIAAALFELSKYDVRSIDVMTLCRSPTWHIYRVHK
jgi:predicted amidophosphoribosyltransferase